MLGFFSSRLNWDPTPSPAGECDPLPFAPGEERGRGGGGGSQFGRGDRHCGTLGINKYVLYYFTTWNGQYFRLLCLDEGPLYVPPPDYVVFYWDSSSLGRYVP